MLNFILSDPEMARLITGKHKRSNGPVRRTLREDGRANTKPDGDEPVQRASLLGRLRDAVAGE